MTTITASTFPKSTHTAAKNAKAGQKAEALPNTTIVVMRRVALGIALVLWSVAAFSGQQYNMKQLSALKCHPYSTQAYSKSSLHTFGACRKL